MNHQMRQTSLDAYGDIDATTIAGRVERDIAVATARGATRDEIHRRTGIGISSLCGRLRELEERGRIVATAHRRLGDSGKDQMVYVHTDKFNLKYHGLDKAIAYKKRQERLTHPDTARLARVKETLRMILATESLYRARELAARALREMDQ